MNNKQLAAAYGLSPNTSKKWSPAKRAAAIADIEAGVKPVVADLVAELAKACYKASMHIKSAVCFDAYYGSSKAWFNIHYNTGYGTPLTYLVESGTELNAINLSGAIAKVEELCHA